MYFILILFFASLLSITYMITRKLIMLKKGQITPRNFSGEVTFKAPALEEWKDVTIKGARKHGYNALVGTMRLYYRGVNVLKNKYVEFRVRVKSSKKKNLEEDGKPEISKFLKVISQYKKKIRKIKQKIKEEEIV